MIRYSIIILCALFTIFFNAALFIYKYWALNWWFWSIYAIAIPNTVFRI